MRRPWRKVLMQKTGDESEVTPSGLDPRFRTVGGLYFKPFESPYPHHSLGHGIHLSG